MNVILKLGPCAEYFESGQGASRLPKTLGTLDLIWGTLGALL